MQFEDHAVPCIIEGLRSPLPDLGLGLLQLYPQSAGCMQSCGVTVTGRCLVTR